MIVETLNSKYLAVKHIRFGKEMVQIIFDDGHSESLEKDENKLISNG